ncbi:hypothetical protein KLP28_06985 [Nocardioidaceae bacterium]|nr:hypothetical protein KLP28_06985 [Nocardioidaceae bacterium]
MTVTIPAGSLMESALLGAHHADALTDHDVLTSAAAALLDAVASAGDVAVRPVGRQGALIVGAASVMSKGALQHAAPGTMQQRHTKVMVVDAVAVGHGVVERAVREVRLAGADWVAAWVWRASPRLNQEAIEADHVDVNGLLD